jgi:hypothetical protein
MRDKLTASILYDEQYYLKMNRDVAGVVCDGVYASGFEHFLEFGRAEHRHATEIFDPGFYQTEYADLPRGWRPGELLDHFLRYGLKEGRHGSRFHKELKTQLKPPQFAEFSRRARDSLAELGREGDGSDLGLRLQQHIRKAQTRFDDDLSTSLDWLRRLHFYQF